MRKLLLLALLVTPLMGVAQETKPVTTSETAAADPAERNKML